MLAVNTILHPTDFSEQSQSALWLASALARDYGARLVVLHVSPLPPVVYGEVMPPPNLDDLREAARSQLDELRLPDSDIRAERRLSEGDPAEEILRTAREAGADLMVMGTHGRTGLGRLLMGSVAEQVMRRADCPVLTVKNPFREGIRATAAPAGAHA